MKRLFRNHRWTWLAAALAGLALVAGVGLGPHLGFTAGARTPLWTERAMDVTPVPTQAPNWVELARGLKPAVVNVSTKRTEGGAQMKSPFGQGDPFEQFFRQFGDQPRRSVRSMGSGFVINPNGHILTNNHVVEGATEITVKLVGRPRAHGQDRRARSEDRPRPPEGRGHRACPSSPSATRRELKVGEPVMAIGNPFGLEQTVTTGIVSATGRVIGQGPYDDFIQTDASINPGNSGGPLINAPRSGHRHQHRDLQSERRVGRHRLRDPEQPGEDGGDPARRVRARVARGWLGVSIQSLTPELAKGFGLPASKGALVARVAEDSPAQKAGIKAGDIITEYDGRKVARSEDLPRLVAETPAGREVPVTLMREGKTINLHVKVTKLDEPDQNVLAEAGEKGKLGVAVEPVTPAIARELGLKETRGVVVKRVEDGSPAANAGLRAGDVIIEVDREPVKDVATLKQLIDKHASGTPLLVLLQRQDATLFVAV